MALADEIPEPPHSVDACLREVFLEAPELLDPATAARPGPDRVGWRLQVSAICSAVWNRRGRPEDWSVDEAVDELEFALSSFQYGYGLIPGEAPSGPRLPAPRGEVLPEEILKQCMALLREADPARFGGPGRRVPGPGPERTAWRAEILRKCQLAWEQAGQPAAWTAAQAAEDLEVCMINVNLDHGFVYEPDPAQPGAASNDN